MASNDGRCVLTYNEMIIPGTNTADNAALAWFGVTTLPIAATLGPRR